MCPNTYKAYLKFIDLPIWFGLKKSSQIKIINVIKSFFVIAIVEKRIFLFQGAGRSGLELIVSLLDGHEESLCLPFTLKFLNIWKQIS